MDVGFIDEPGSTELVVNRTSGPFTLFANEYGFNHLALSGGSISGFALQGNEEDPQGFELDNLEYTIPAPPPPPPPPPPAPSCARVVLVDSRGSGEKKGIISPPGEELDIPLMNALGPGAVAIKLNPYPADKIFGWFPASISTRSVSQTMVYYALALALFSEGSYEEVMRNLVEGLDWSAGWRGGWQVPSKVAISKARARLGAEPLRSLYEQRRDRSPRRRARAPSAASCG